MTTVSTFTATKLFIGIDPGQGGAIAVLINGEFDAVHSMPLEAKRKGNQVDCAELFKIASTLRHRMFQMNAKASIVIEQVSANPHQGVSSMFSFGDSYGCARFFAALLDSPVTFVPPARWKQAMGLSKLAKKSKRKLTPKQKKAEKAKRYAEAKRYSLTRAKRLFPTAREHLAAKKHEGRAEALLLARYLHDFPSA